MVMLQTNGKPKATTTSWAAVGDALGSAFGGTASCSTRSTGPVTTR